MKKFVNDPADFVPEFMAGVLAANPDLLEGNLEFQMIKRKDAPRADKVSVVQGSGSGHEPAHVMAVGPGMLDGACQGPVFAAPPVDACYETIKALATPAGVLVLVNNYQGDRMAWDTAVELAQAEDIVVDQFIINDDVAVKDSTWTVGRRGVAGNFFVMKACGAAAEEGQSLAQVKAVAEKVNANVRTMGVALTSCIPPAKGTPIFDIGDDEMEVGVGIHGEPGRERAKDPERGRDHPDPVRCGGGRPALRFGRPGGADGQRPRRHARRRNSTCCTTRPRNCAPHAG